MSETDSKIKEASLAESMSSQMDTDVLKTRIAEVRTIMSTPHLDIVYTNCMVRIKAAILLPVGTATLLCLHGLDEEGMHKLDNLAQETLRRMKRTIQDSDGMFMLVSQLAEILHAALVPGATVSDTGLEAGVKITHSLAAEFESVQGIYFLIHCMCYCAAEFESTGGW